MPNPAVTDGDVVQQGDGSSDVKRLRVVISVAAIALFVATWRLWTPQEVFPQVPFVRWAGSLSAWTEWLGGGVLLVAVALAGFVPRGRVWQWALLVFVAAGVWMVLVDQHRLQPWVYQFLLIAVALVGLPERRAVVWLRWLTVSIYFYSALSKLDYSFLATHGQQLVEGLLKPAGLSLPARLAWRWTAAALLPAGELAVAAGLCIPRLRRAAMYGSLVMHGLLLVALGPWGLGHKPGVLIWNAYFIAQNWVLFGSRAVEGETFGREDRRGRETRAEHGGRETRAEPRCLNAPHPGPLPKGEGGLHWLPIGVLLAAMGLPVLEPFGLFDHWPAWAVYAARAERVHVYVDASERQRLPAELLAHLEPPRFVDERSRLRLDRWSLGAIGVPIYPKDRFLLGVALAVAERFALGPHVLVEIDSAADRWTGRRTSRQLVGTAELQRAVESFRLNAAPRKSRQKD